MTIDLANRVIKPDPNTFWQCPQCRARYWTLNRQEKVTCHCAARMVPISMSSYMKPNGFKPSDQAYVSADEPSRFV